MDEKELSKKITEYLNKGQIVGSKFKFIDDFCDIADEKNKIFIEVKPDHFAPAQILHAIARKGIKDSKFLGVADNKEVKLYRPPPFEKIRAFATGFDPTLTFTPSQVDKNHLNEQAFKILSEPDKTIELKFPKTSRRFIDKDNLLSVRKETERYKIDLDLLIDWLDGIGETDTIRVSKDGWLVAVDRLPPENVFTNELQDEQQQRLGGKPKHLAIRLDDREWFESLRVRHEDLAEILHEVDRLLTRKKRREKGVFWTEAEVGDKVADEVLALTKPAYVVEPCVGGGSLVRKIVPLVKGTMNDIDVVHVENCKKIFDGYGWRFTTLNVVSTFTDDLIKKWSVPAEQRLLLYTNPPFGTRTSNVLVSKKGEMNGKLSRSQLSTQIGERYPEVLEKYGKGDLFLPIVGRLIEIARVHKKTWIAFFSPFGLYCGKYPKLLDILLKDFRFLRGYVFAGFFFHDISGIKPVGFSIWEYAPNTNGKPLDLSFDFMDKTGNTKPVTFSKLPLLKDGWKYDQRDKGIVKGEIVVQHCESFNAPAPKVFHDSPKKGGSEVIPENVIKPLGIPNLPDELAYALWSASVGAKVFWTSSTNILHPIYFDNAYVHLPDFSRSETLEILAYSALHAVLRNYAPGKIGFIGSNKIFRFGGGRLTKGVEYLFSHFGKCPVYEGHSISDVLNDVRQGKENFAECTKGIKAEVAKRQDSIGYWEYVPIP